MDYKNIAIHLYKLASYCFDVGSDIATGVDFLKGRNYSEGNGTNVLEEDQSTIPDTAWGAVTLSLVFMPGLILGVAFGMGFIARDWKNCGNWMKALFLLVLSTFWPVIVPFDFLHNIVRMMKKKEVREQANARITIASGLEASLEALPQLVLQLHTILNGYETTWIQILSIVSSFTTIAISSITCDIEYGHSGEDEEDRTLKEKARIFVERLPCYMTTIIFRCVSLTFTISFLREYSPIPIILLLVELIIVSAIRISKSEGSRTVKLSSICFLVVSNVGTMNGYTLLNVEHDGDFVEEDDQDVASFIKISAIVTTIHHFLVMIAIITMGSVDPNIFPHWKSPELLLSPSGHDFYWAITLTMVLGVNSLILLLYRARNIVVIKKKKTSENEESSL